MKDRRLPPQSGVRKEESRAKIAPRWTPDGRPVCLYCQKAGHYKRDCLAFKSKGMPNNNAVRPPKRSYQGN